jgi:hypothetical protein
MSYRMKITLADPTVAQLEALAEQRGEPASRVAAQMISVEIADRKDPHRRRTSAETPAPAENPDPDRRAPWIEPFLDYKQWRALMWGLDCRPLRPLSP